MKAHWWSCTLGLLFMHAEGMHWTATQSPASIRRVEVNSSLEISCSTSLSNPLALSLHRLFEADIEIVYLALKDKRITKENPRPYFRDRVHVTRERSESEYQVTLQLSKLKENDTDLYYCKWTHMIKCSVEYLKSNGTVLIVREKRPEAQCQILTLDLVLVCAGTTAFVLILSFYGVYLCSSRQIKRNFRPTLPPRPDRAHRHGSCSCNSQPPQNQPYLVTSLQSAYFNRKSVSHHILAEAPLIEALLTVACKGKMRSKHYFCSAK